LEPRPWWFRKLARRILGGLEKAAVVFYSTEAVRSDMVRFDLLDPAKLVHAPYGVDRVFQARNELEEYPQELKSLEGLPWLLHVGATIPRKRIDVLLNVLAAVRETVPELRLCKVGGDWTKEQQAQIVRDDLGRSIIHLGKVSQELLVAAYQRASAVLITSDAEGFGLPVIESLACGAPVIASDIPVLRESGGDAANFAAVGDIGAWVEIVLMVLDAKPLTLTLSPDDKGEVTKWGIVSVPSLETRLAWASRFSWAEHARIIGQAYQRLLVDS